jgi:integrase/recombinase XerC
MRAKASPRPLAELIEAFLLQKQVNGCSPRTVAVYKWWLDRLAVAVTDTAALDSLAMTRFFAALRERGVSASTVHQAFRTFRTFTRWLMATGVVRRNPLDGLAIRTPKTLPAVPTEEELKAALYACSDSVEGTRNYAIILVMADAGLRASETLHLLVEDWHPHERSVFVRSGKGARDRTVFVGATTARALKVWLFVHPQPGTEAWLFCQRDGRPLTNRGLITVLHRLSARAGLPPNRRLHPHSLRHLAATEWLRSGSGLDHVRRLLGHSSLSTTLRYSALVSADLQRAHRDGAAIDRMGIDRFQRVGRGRDNARNGTVLPPISVSAAPVKPHFDRSTPCRHACRRSERSSPRRRRHQRARSGHKPCP